MGHCIHQCNVSAQPGSPEMKVGGCGCGCLSWVHYDDLCTLFYFLVYDPVENRRMHFCHITSYYKEKLSFFHISKSPGRSITSKSLHIPPYCACHTQPGICIVIIGTYKSFYKLVQDNMRLCIELSGYIE